MFRPLHELNEGWTWWGGNANTATGSAKLFQVTHAYLESKGLNNLIYVWAPKDTAGGASSVRNYYPGDAYVDVVALDVWVGKFPSTDWYNALSAIAGTNKPMALGEVGSVPQPSQMNSQPKWVFWSVWMDWLTMPDYNSNASIQAGYYDARTFNQGEVHIPTGNQPPRPRPPATGPGPSPASAASASMSPTPPTAPPSSFMTATAPPLNNGLSAPTAPSAPSANASTSPDRAPPTAARSSSGTATDPALNSGPPKPTATCATRNPAATSTSPAAPPPTTPACRSGTPTPTPGRSGGSRPDR
jgi:hypothetical protein